MIAHITSHIFEQIVRLILIVLITPKLLEYSLDAAVTGVVLVNIVSELTSIIILIFFLPKKVKIKKADIIPDKGIIRDVLNISIPTTGSRIVGSIGYFFEPIILTFILLEVGYSNHYILDQYGVLNGYVLPLLMIPSFFTQAISSALIPIISKGYVNKRIAYVKGKIKQAEIISLAIGLVVTTIIMIYPDACLKIIFNTNHGSEYLRVMTPFFLGYYVQVPLTAALQAMDRAKEAMMSTVIGIIIKIGLILGLSILRIGLYGLVIATIVNIFIVTIYNFVKVKKVLSKQGYGI
jgi:stage V sporulation protein B